MLFSIRVSSHKHLKHLHFLTYFCERSGRILVGGGKERKKKRRVVRKKKDQNQTNIYDATAVL